MKKADLIIRLMSGLYGLSMDTANVVADYIIARETALLDSLTEKVKKLPRYMEMQQAVISDVVDIIQRRKVDHA
jgi:hypothetical protein